jgi:phage baseplate assembly protein W
MIEWANLVASYASNLHNEEIETDIRLRFDQLGADLSISRTGDILTISEIDNLAQAIINRLSTDQGELYDIGHPDYGSRLYEVIGEVNNEFTRRRIKVLIEECLVEEHRIKKVINVKVLPDNFDQQRVYIELTILTQLSEEYLTLNFPFRLEA